MTIEAIANDFATTLSAGVNNSTTTIPLTSVTGAPSGGEWRLKVDDEIMLVQSVASLNATVVRGQEGTTAASHSSAAAATHVLTAAALPRFTREYLGMAASPDIKVGGANDLEFDSTTIGGSALGSPTVIDADTTAKSCLYIKKTSASGFALHGRYFTSIPGFPFTVTAKILAGSLLGTNYMRMGMGICEASPGKTEGIYWEQNTNTPPKVISSISSSTPSSGAAYVTTGGWGEFNAGLPLYLRCVVTSSTVIQWQFSSDGLAWRNLGASRNPGFTVGGVFVALDAENTTYDIEAMVDYIRFT